MNRKLQWIGFAVVVVVLTASVLFTSQASTHAASKSTAISHVTQKSTPTFRVTARPAWVVQGDPYVHVINYVATVDSAIRKHVSSQIVSQVMQAVHQYNSTSLKLRQLNIVLSPQNSHLKELNAQGMTACGAWASARYYWWGFQLYVNSCLVNDITFGGYTGASLAGLIAAVCPPCAPIAGTIAAIIGFYTSWLSWANTRCGSRGAYIDKYWWATWMWIQSVC